MSRLCADAVAFVLVFDEGRECHFVWEFYGGGRYGENVVCLAW